MKNLIIAAAVIALGWAAFKYFDWSKVKVAPEPALTSGIRGEARLGPICPAVRRSEPGSGECADKLYQADFLLYKGETAIVAAEFSTDERGQFSVSLPPGEYRIRNKPSGNPYPKCGGTGIVPVEEGKFAEVIVFCDTGIR